RGRVTEGEARELKEPEPDRDIAFARLVQQASRSACARRSREQQRVDGVIALGAELEVGLSEGADNAVFRGGAGINRQRHTRAGREVIIITIALAEVARPGRLIVDAA